MEACRRNVGCVEQKSNTLVGNTYSRVPGNKTNSILTIPASFRDNMMNPGISETSYIPQRVVSGAPPHFTMVWIIVFIWVSQNRLGIWLDHRQSTGNAIVLHVAIHYIGTFIDMFILYRNENQYNITNHELYMHRVRSDRILRQ
jgi:hypothetical protein